MLQTFYLQGRTPWGPWRCDCCSRRLGSC
jgi:hypothetical protein